MTFLAGRRMLPLARGLSTLGLGALAALALAWADTLSRSEPEAPGAPAVWLCDRDGHALVGLDQDGFVAARVPIRWPLEVAAGPLGSPWVLAAVQPGPGGERRLLRVPGGERAVEELRLPAALGLRSDASGAALFLGGEEADVELLRLEPGGRLRSLAPAPEARHWLLAESDLWLAGAREICVRDLSSSAAPVRARRAWPEGERCLDLAEAPGGAWVLSERDARRTLRYLTPELELLDGREWAAPAGDPGAARFVSRSAGGEPWIVGGSWGARGPQLQPWPPTYLPQYLTPRASETARLLRGDVVGAAAAPGGGLWCLTPGACLRLDSRARPLLAQGGFECLVALDAVRR